MQLLLTSARLNVVDDTFDVITEGQWRRFDPPPPSSSAAAQNESIGS